jgi:hypothetical protein
VNKILKVIKNRPEDIIFEQSSRLTSRIQLKCSIFAFRKLVIVMSKRFFISWLASSLVMFVLSYVWHGIILTDFSRLSYSKGLFMVFAALVYLMIGFVVAKAIEVKMLEKHFKRKPIARGAISGAFCGIAFFLVATVVGVSFSTGSKLENMLLDVTWQTIEQTIGGIVVGLTHIFVFDPMAHIED